jgi:glycine/D-amino acid oxidase-like deaminating enzyme
MARIDTAGEGALPRIRRMSPSLPTRADVVVIGGGIVGCSIAYHLAKLGITDVVLLERRQLTCGTTWHAAGLVPQLRATRTLTELAKYTSELFRGLEAETGQATGFRQNGSIGVALNAGRFEELKRGASMARAFGVDVEVIGPSEVKARYPLIDLDGVVGGVWLPADGQTNPVDTTLALAKGARAMGVRVVEGVEVEDLLVENGRAVGVRAVVAGREGERLAGIASAAAGGGARGGPAGPSPSGAERVEIRARTVVLAAGMWSHWLARRVGVRLALQAAEHFYVVTEAIDGLPRDLPTLRVPDEWAYYKEDAGKLLVGAFEPVAKPWGLAGIPRDFCFDALPDDVDHFTPVLERAIARVPRLATAGIATCSTAPRASRPTTATCSARPPKCATSSSPAASTRSASSPRAAPARCSPSGSATAGCRRTCRAWRCAGWRPSRARAPTCATAPSRAWGCCTQCTGRSGSRRPRAARATRRSTNGCSPPAPAWASWAAGSGPTGTRCRGSFPMDCRATSTPGDRRTGSATPPPSAARCATRWRCSISRRWRSSWCRGATPARC